MHLRLRTLAFLAFAWFGVSVAVPAGISASIVFDRTHSPPVNLLTCGKSCVFSWYTCTGDCAFCHPTLRECVAY